METLQRICILKSWSRCLTLLKENHWLCALYQLNVSLYLSFLKKNVINSDKVRHAIKTFVDFQIDSSNVSRAYITFWNYFTYVVMLA